MNPSKRLNERLTPLLRSIMEKGPAGCACTVVRRGEVVYSLSKKYLNSISGLTR
jgi:hypothetical protein